MLTRIRKWIDRRIINYIDYAVSSREKIYTCEVRGHVIFLEVESEIEKFRATTYSTKEPETLDWIQRYFRPNDIMYDIGANIGLYSLFAAKHLKSRCKVYAFEPEALNHAKLSKNVYLNGLSGIIFPCCLALHDRPCFDVLHLHSNIYNPEDIGDGLIAGSALHAFGEAVDYSGEAFRPIHKQGMFGDSLDHLVSSLGMDFPNHIKIDVDGTEEKIVDGAAQIIEDGRLKSILVEISEKRGAKDPIYKRLTSAGFVPDYDFPQHSSQQLKEGPYEDSVNTVFVRR